MGRSKHASSYKWLPRAVMQWSPVLFGGFLVGRGQSRSPELAPHLPMAVFVAISSSRASQAADFSASTIFCSASFWFSSSSWMVASFSLSRPPSRRLHWAEDREHRYSPLRGLCSQHTRLHTTQWDSPNLGSQENQIKSNHLHEMSSTSQHLHCHFGGGISEWQPTPVFLPGECHGQRSLADYSPWGCKTVRCDWVTNNTFDFQNDYISENSASFDQQPEPQNFFKKFSNREMLALIKQYF